MTVSDTPEAQIAAIEGRLKAVSNVTYTDLALEDFKLNARRDLRFLLDRCEALTKIEKNYRLLAQSINEDESTCPEGCDSFGHVAECKTGESASIIEQLRARVAALSEALEQITKGEGRFSMDHLTHASNTIDDMKAIAREALGAARSAAPEGGETR